MFAEAVILIDDRLIKRIDITLEQWLDLKFRDHKKVDKEIMKEVVSTWLIRSYKKQFEELEDDDLKNEALKEKAILEGSWGHENRYGMNFCSWLKECFSNYQELDYELVKKLKEYWWGKKEEEELNDDDIRDLEDYLIAQDASYYVDEKEERIKERKDKLLGIPYEKPPTFKSKKFKVIKYSLGPSEEYVAIKEYEYDIWVQTEETSLKSTKRFFAKRTKGGP
nr:RNA-directed DNA polymerase, eukaryota, reverse transcriptase zinc-binding domain protein [Tanacetum cinerariifolium]